MNFFLKFLKISYVSFFCVISFSVSAEPIRQLSTMSFGTGFIVDKEGYVVTAWHVIKNKHQIYVGPIVGNKWKKAKIIKFDEKRDLVLLKIQAIDRPAVEIAEWSDVPIGLEVYSIGYPIPKVLGLSKKMTQGLVNGNKTDAGDEGFFQFSAETQKGNSGGPVFSPDGLVIGVVQRKLDALKLAERSKDLPENVNYALKSASLIKFLEDAGIKVMIKRLNLLANVRPYEIFRDKNESVLAIFAQGEGEDAPNLGVSKELD